MRSKRLLKPSESPFLDWDVEGTTLIKRAHPGRAAGWNAAVPPIDPAPYPARLRIRPASLAGRWLLHGLAAGCVVGMLTALGMLVWAGIEGEALGDHLGWVVAFPFIGAVAGVVGGGLLALLLIIALLASHLVATTVSASEQGHVLVARLTAVVVLLVLWRLWGLVALGFAPAALYVLATAHRIVPKYLIVDTRRS